ncbi:hypothetical protein D3C85_1279090 [compost metagenome]
MLQEILTGTSLRSKFDHCLNCGGAAFNRQHPTAPALRRQGVQHLLAGYRIGNLRGLCLGRLDMIYIQQPRNGEASGTFFRHSRIDLADNCV